MCLSAISRCHVLESILKTAYIKLIWNARILNQYLHLANVEKKNGWERAPYLFHFIHLLSGTHICNQKKENNLFVIRLSPQWIEIFTQSKCKDGTVKKEKNNSDIEIMIHGGVSCRRVWFGVWRIKLFTQKPFASTFASTSLSVPFCIVASSKVFCVFVFFPSFLGMRQNIWLSNYIESSTNRAHTPTNQRETIA